LAPVALRAPYAKSLNPPSPLLPCKLNPEPHTRFGPNAGPRSVQISPSVTEGALPPGHSAVTPAEATLDCASCHSNKDPHRGLMGTDCVQCHRTSEWTIPEFRHPSPTSVSCAQCHQAPPSHYMMHFKVVCQAVARQPNAQVNQCYACHQTDDWNDIKGVGWYMHH
jgi:hypothetical protein